MRYASWSYQCLSTLASFYSWLITVNNSLNFLLLLHHFQLSLGRRSHHAFSTVLAHWSTKHSVVLRLGSIGILINSAHKFRMLWFNSFSSLNVKQNKLTWIVLCWYSAAKIRCFESRRTYLNLLRRSLLECELILLRLHQHLLGLHLLINSSWCHLVKTLKTVALLYN